MTQFGKGCHLHLIDGSAFIFRAYHALPPLARQSDGLPIGALSGFCNMLQRYVEGNNGADAATHVAVIFDKGSHTFRNDLYDQYKANREEMPEDLRPQIPLTRDATVPSTSPARKSRVSRPMTSSPRCLAGARGRRARDDRQLRQGPDAACRRRGRDARPMKNRRIDSEAVEEKFGVRPDRVVDVQALAGDSVDNIPGAPGIGIKTAALLINEFGSLAELLDRAGEITQPKRRQTLIEKRDQIEMSMKLVQLDRNMSLDFTLDDLEVRDPDPETLLGFLARMEFRTITQRVADRLGVEPPVIEAPSVQTADADDNAADEASFDPDAYVRVSRSIRSRTGSPDPGGRCRRDRYRNHRAGRHDRRAGRHLPCRRARRGVLHPAGSQGSRGGRPVRLGCADRGPDRPAAGARSSETGPRG